MQRLGRNFSKRRQRKTALLHGWMWDPQAFFIDELIVKKQQIDIYGSWPLGLRAGSAHLCFYLQQSSHEIFSVKAGAQLKGTIHKPRLFGNFHWLSLIEGRNLVYFPQPFQTSDRFLKLYAGAVHIGP